MNQRALVADTGGRSCLGTDRCPALSVAFATCHAWVLFPGMAGVVRFGRGPVPSDLYGGVSHTATLS